MTLLLIGNFVINEHLLKDRRFFNRKSFIRRMIYKAFNRDWHSKNELTGTMVEVTRIHKNHVHQFYLFYFIFC